MPTAPVLDRPTAAPRYLPLLVLSAAAGLDAGSVAVLNSALPSLGAEFGTSAQDLSWAVTGYALAFAGLLLCGGAMADRFRRRRVLAAGLLTLAAGAVLALLAPAFWPVAVGRVMQGAGAAVTVPAATALVTELYPAGAARSRALGVYASAQAGCYGAGLVLGGVITDVLGWRWVFVLQAAAAVITAAAAVRCLPAGTAQRARRLDPVGGGALVAAIVLLVLGADLATRPGDGLFLLVLGAAAAAGAVWWRRGRPRCADEVLLDRALLRMKGVRTAAFVGAAFYFCVSGSLFLLPLHLQRVQGMTAAESGLAVLPVSLAVTGAALLSGRLIPRFGARPVLAVGLTATAGGVLLWYLTSAHSSYWWPVFAGLVITGAGQGLSFPAITVTGLGGVGEAAHGTASAVTVTALQIGSALGPAVLAAVAASAGSGTPSLSGHHLAYAVAAAVVLLLGLPAAVRIGAAGRITG
ncbi:MFS transporter [Streptomyces sp. BE147]|uniref:MFS transporter n=1 Tax=Streptomyces sp. BE147 TaxID=3002524 RepID=UPI002E78FEFD|nr:MFS transporter [Streptomyces sp. BE147]MEE1742561.1 MFS transporter [Streptomyces sp. BE147]